MMTYLLGFLFFLPLTVMGAGALDLSKTDSLTLINHAIFPIVQNEIVMEQGKEINIKTRGLQSGDALLLFSCRQKYYAGMEIDALCTANISTEAKVHEGNRLQTGIAGSLRATIGWPDDILKLSQAFRNIGSCRSDVVTQLYASQERREVVLPNGKKLQVPIMTVGCFGDEMHHTLSQLIVTIFPR